MSSPATLTQLKTDRAAVLDPDELLRRCKDAARWAVRPPYSSDDRAECAADLYTDAVLTAASEMPKRTGRPAEVLAYIGAVLASNVAATTAALPKRGDARCTFTALKNRALNWRESRDAARSREALIAGGRDATAEVEPAHHNSDSALSQYHAAGASQDAEVAHRAALAATAAAGMTGDHGVYLLMYRWARGVSAADAAAELDFTHTAYRAAESRGAKRLRSHVGAAQLMYWLAGAPRWADGYVFTLRDESREAHGRTPIMAQDGRTGTASTWGEDGLPVNVPAGRHLTAQDAADACSVTRRRPAPKTSADRRTAALAGRDADEVTSQSRAALGAALDRRAAVHAGTGLRKSTEHGRTSGRPPERYAPRSVRLG